MIDAVPPAVIFIIGALLVPLIKGKWKGAFLLLIPIVGFINLIHIPEGTHWVVGFAGYDLVFGKVDRLSLIFGYIFHLITFIALLYALHLKDDLQHVGGLIYAGSALGVVFAGDLFSFFVFWEMLTVSSVLLIWARRTKASTGAGYRYLLIHAIGGLCLLAGIVLYVAQNGSIEFGYIGLNGLASYLIFIGFGINCAWPIFHPWLTDAYPEATITGVIFLSAFTTKTAVYALARAFPGTEALIWIGAIMTGFPIFYAVIENDLRRVLAYSLINQVGFMVCGIGIGTALAINGAIAHAFNDIIFKSLLFMSMGAIMYRTGKINGTALGGLYRTMPLTCIFCMVGAASISAFPLFSGFVSKSMVMSAAGAGHLKIVWFILLFASAGVFHHAGIKIPFFAFFGHDSGMRPKEAPLNMLLAMGIAAFLCIFIGSYPGPLYSLLPYPVDYLPYTMPHVVGQTQILFFSALAFTLLLLAGIYPPEMRCVNIDVDWFYRKAGRLFCYVTDKVFNGINAFSDRFIARGLPRVLGRLSRHLPEILTLGAMLPLWTAFGAKGEELQVKIKKARFALETGTAPIGISAAVATIFLVVIFFLI
ncbi:MAG: Na(+)/H(+) antiporter subunit D [Desulfobacterales bacterium S7086C20]|nr:MAG: Na(+)/H(+) antiporter subunit D [Desulfobacterales bacterium S7086C20]